MAISVAIALKQCSQRFARDSPPVARFASDTLSVSSIRMCLRAECRRPESNDTDNVWSHDPDDDRVNDWDNDRDNAVGYFSNKVEIYR